MPVLITNIKMPIDADIAELPGIICGKLFLPAGSVKAVRVIRQSLDARKKNDAHFLISAIAGLEPSAQTRVIKQGLATAYEPPEAYTLKEGNETPKGRIIVAGFGPAGLFAAYILAKGGYKPVVIERGCDVDTRSSDVERFFETGKLNENSNVVFGEGGAGTFSDGKLTSRSKNPRAGIILQTLAEHGAPHEIVYMAKPHIGTDILGNVVKSMRNEIIAQGGEIWFSTRLTDISSADGELTHVTVARGGTTEKIEAAACILAVGQAARDVYEMLLSRGVELQARPFGIGVRIEHPQSLIDKAQHGALAGHPRLGAAEYALTAKSGGRGVYTFCMCPGGSVVAATPDLNQIVTNGMSNNARDGKNANAAILVQVGPGDFGNEPLAGINYRDEIERKAFAAGYGYTAPAQRLEDFLERRKSTGFCSVEPTYRPGLSLCRLDLLLPEYIVKGIADGIHDFANKLKGFDYPDAVLTAVESRPSSAVRIVRDGTMQAPLVGGLFPVGEGAGYAGGIMSAAIDGIMAAEIVAGKYKPGRGN